jgi:prepilin peptidase CpaA
MSDVSMFMTSPVALQYAIVVAIVVVASVCDVRTRRIPNVLTFGGAAAAVLFHAFMGELSDVAWSVAGWGTGLALFLPWFLLRGMGAGDVKLLAMVGAWIGPRDALWAAFFTALIGMAMAVVVVIVHRYTRQAFVNLKALVTSWWLGGVRPLPEVTLEGSRGPRLAYAVPIAAGTVLTVWLRA